MSEKTVTMPLSEYQELKARIESLETNGFYAKKIIRRLPVPFARYFYPEMADVIEFKNKDLCELIVTNDRLLEENQRLNHLLNRIPSFIRNFFGA